LLVSSGQWLLTGGFPLVTTASTPEQPKRVSCWRLATR
jgi:hypothetical protein